MKSKAPIQAISSYPSIIVLTEVLQINHKANTHDKILRDIKNYWYNKKSISRKDSVGTFQLKTEHDCKKIVIYNSEMYNLWRKRNSKMNREHLLNVLRTWEIC